MSPLPFCQIDAFTDRPFAGNPAAVFLLPAPGDESWMQRVAGEMNLSETAFLHREGADFRLRWFTPLVEVQLCGHATLAAAHALWTEGHLPADEVARFATLSGPLSARRDGDWIEMDFPARTAAVALPPPELATALGARPGFVGRNQDDYLVEVASEAELRSLSPDFDRLARLPVRGVIVTAPSATAEFDFVSRFFAPAVGVSEDPVTGSAHCCLAPWWGERLGKSELRARQLSARGGVVRMRLAGDRVLLAGQAVTVVRGWLHA